MKARKIILTAGIMGLLLIWLILTPSGLLGKSDAVGYSVCHRFPSHSYFLGSGRFLFVPAAPVNFWRFWQGSWCRLPQVGEDRVFPAVDYWQFLDFWCCFL
jgi:hypothetical protein